MLTPEKLRQKRLPGARSYIVRTGGRKGEDKRYLPGDFEPKILVFGSWGHRAYGVFAKDLCIFDYYFSITFGGVFKFEFCSNKSRVEPNAPVYLSTR